MPHFDLFPKQVEFFKQAFSKENTIIGFGGGIKGAKTSTSLMIIRKLLQIYPQSRAVVVRDSLPTLKRNTYPVFQKTFPKYFQKPYFNFSEQRITFPEKSELQFFSENYDSDKELNRWRGLDFNFILLEELNELREESFWKAVERAGSWLVPNLAPEKQPPIKIICTFNPSQGFVKNLFYDRHTQNKLPKGWVFIQSLLFDNPYNTDAFKENLKQLPQSYYDTFVLGDWNAFKEDDLFVETFSKEKHVSNEAVYNKELDLHLSFDFNVTNTVTVWQLGYDFVHCIKEYHLEGIDLEGICEQIKQDYPNKVFFTTGDASGDNGNAFTSGNVSGWDLIRRYLSLTMFQMAIPNQRRANPNINSSRLVCNMLFKHENIKINPECVLLIKDLASVKREYDTFKRKNPDYTHALDTLRYFFWDFLYDRFEMYGIDLA